MHGSGVLAWLPNRDYEVTVRVRITLEHERSGAQDATVEQKAFFRTKGLAGLNAVARVGDEIEPYVESRYPGPGGARLYRHESIAGRVHRALQHPRAGQPNALDERPRRTRSWSGCWRSRRSAA